MAFGKNLDAHETPVPASSTLARFTLPPADHMITNLCQTGKECYADTLKLTIGANAIAFLLTVWIALRDRKSARLLSEEELKGVSGVPVWDEDEDQ